MTTSVSEGARRFRACTPLTKSEEKDRLLAVYIRYSVISEVTIYSNSLIICQKTLTFLEFAAPYLSIKRP